MILFTLFLIGFFAVFLFIYYSSINDVFTNAKPVHQSSSTNLSTTGGELSGVLKTGSIALWRFIRRWWLVFLFFIFMILIFGAQEVIEIKDPYISGLDVTLNTVVIPGYKLITYPLRWLKLIYNAVIPITNLWGGTARIFYNSAVEIALECKIDWSAFFGEIRESFFELYVSLVNFFSSALELDLNLRPALNNLRIAFLRLVGLLDCECHMLRNAWNLVEIFATQSAVEAIHLYVNIIIRIFVWFWEITRDIINFVREAIAFGFSDAFQNWYWKPSRGFSLVRTLTLVIDFFANLGSIVDDIIAILAESFGGLAKGTVPRIFTLTGQRLAQLLDSLNIIVASFLRYPGRSFATFVIKYLDDSHSFSLGKNATLPAFNVVDIWGSRFRTVSTQTKEVFTAAGLPLVELCDHLQNCTISPCCKDDVWRDFGNRFGRSLDAIGEIIAAFRNMFYISLEMIRKMLLVLHYGCYFCEGTSSSTRSDINDIFDLAIDEIQIELINYHNAIVKLLLIIDRETAIFYLETSHVTESSISLIKEIIEASRNGRLSRRQYLHSDQFVQSMARIFFEVDSSFIALANIIRQIALDFPTSKRLFNTESFNLFENIRMMERSGEKRISYSTYSDKRRQVTPTTCAYRDPHSIAIDFHPVLANAENSTITNTINDVYAAPELYVEPLCCIANVVEEVGLLIAGIVKTISEIVVISLHSASIKEASLEFLSGPLNLRRELMPLVDALLRDSFRNQCFKLGLLRVISQRFDFLGLPPVCHSGEEPFALIVDILTTFVRRIINIFLEVIQRLNEFLRGIVAGTAPITIRNYFLIPQVRGEIHKELYVITFGSIFDLFGKILNLLTCSISLDNGASFFQSMNTLIKFFGDDGKPLCTNILPSDTEKTFTDFICRAPLITNSIIEGIIALFSGDFIEFLIEKVREGFLDVLQCGGVFTLNGVNWIRTFPYFVCVRIRRFFPTFRIGNFVWSPFSRLCDKLAIRLLATYDANYEIWQSPSKPCENILDTCSPRWLDAKERWTSFSDNPRCVRPTQQLPFGCFKTRLLNKQWLPFRNQTDLGCCGIHRPGAPPAVCCGGLGPEYIRGVNCSIDPTYCFIGYDGSNVHCRHQYGDEPIVHVPGEFKSLSSLKSVESSYLASEMTPFIDLADDLMSAALMRWCEAEYTATQQIYNRVIELNITTNYSSPDNITEENITFTSAGLTQAGEKLKTCLMNSMFASFFDQVLILATEDEDSQFDMREFARDPDHMLIDPQIFSNPGQIISSLISFVASFPWSNLFSGNAETAAKEYTSDELIIRLAKLADMGTSKYNAYYEEQQKHQQKKSIEEREPEIVPREEKLAKFNMIVEKAGTLKSYMVDTWSKKFSKVGRIDGGIYSGYEAILSRIEARRKWREQGSLPFAEPMPGRGTITERHFWAAMLQEEMELVETGKLNKAKTIRALRIRRYPGIEEEHLLAENAHLTRTESRHLPEIEFSLRNNTNNNKRKKTDYWERWQNVPCINQPQVGDCVQERMQKALCPAIDGIANLDYCEDRFVYDSIGDSLGSVRCRTALTPLGLKPSCEKYALIGDGDGYCCNTFDPNLSVANSTFENCTDYGQEYSFMEGPFVGLDEIDILQICISEYAQHCYFSNGSCPQTDDSTGCRNSGGRVSTGSNLCASDSIVTSACCANSTCNLYTLEQCKSKGGVWEIGKSCSDSDLHGNCGNCDSDTCNRCDVVTESINDIVDMGIFVEEDLSKMKYGACCRLDNTCNITEAAGCPISAIVNPSQIFSRRNIPPPCLPGVNCKITIWRFGQDCSSCWFHEDDQTEEDAEKLRQSAIIRVRNFIVDDFKEKWNVDDPEGNFDFPDREIIRSGDLSEESHNKIGVQFIFWLQMRINYISSLFGADVNIDLIEIGSKVRYFFDLSAPKTDPRNIQYWALIAFTCDPINHSRCDRAPFGLGLPLGILIAGTIIFVIGFFLRRFIPSIWGIIAGTILIAIFIGLVVIIAYGYSPICFFLPGRNIFKTRTQTGAPNLVGGSRGANNIRNVAGDRHGAGNRVVGRSVRSTSGGRAIIRYPMKTIKFAWRSMWATPVLPNCLMNDTVELFTIDSTCYQGYCDVACPFKEDIWPCGWIPNLPSGQNCSSEPDCCLTAPCPGEDETRRFPDCSSDPYNLDNAQRVFSYYLQVLINLFGQSSIFTGLLHNAGSLTDSDLKFPEEAFTDPRWKYCARQSIPLGMSLLFIVLISLLFLYFIGFAIIRILLKFIISHVYQFSGKFGNTLKERSKSNNREKMKKE